MNKFFFRASLPILLCIFLFLSAFSPHPCANASLLITNPPASITATAETSATPAAGDYACILSEDTFFYSAADERRGLFLLPKSYYVRLIEYGREYCRVEYQRNESAAERLVGYVKTEKLTFVNYVPARPYLYYVFDVTYTIDNTEPNDSSFLTEITVSCTYYGDYLVGSERYCYVLRGDEFGYIPKPAKLTYEENTEYADYLASLTPPKTETPSETEERKSSPVQIAILIAICLLVPVLAALILKPPRRPPYETEE